jgi:hypothetical protein
MFFVSSDKLAGTARTGSLEGGGLGPVIDG